MPDNVLNTTALITGAASGIGRALARELASRGARLALLDLNEETLLPLARELNALPLVADTTDPDAVARAASEAHDALGPIELLFLNAGVAAVGPLHTMPLDDARWVLDVNVMGTLCVAQHFIPEMVKAGRGRVVFTASIAGLIGPPSMAVYGASKHAVVGLAESLRIELAGSGVTVTTICPGRVNTGLHQATRYHNDGFKAFLDSTHLALTPEHVAKRSIRAALAGKRTLVLGPEKLAVCLHRFSPRAYTWLSHRLGTAIGLLGQEQQA